MHGKGNEVLSRVWVGSGLVAVAKGRVQGLAYLGLLPGVKEGSTLSIIDFHKSRTARTRDT